MVARSASMTGSPLAGWGFSALASDQMPSATSARRDLCSARFDGVIESRRCYGLLADE